MMNRKNRLLAISLVLAISNLTFGNLIFAAGPSARRSEKKTSVRTESSEVGASTSGLQTQERNQAERQYSAEQLEELRGKFLELVDTVREFSDLILPDNTDLATKLDEARRQFEQFTPQQLNLIRATMDPSTMNTRLAEARATLGEFRPILEPIRRAKLKRLKLQRSSDGLVIESPTLPENSIGLPDRDSPDDVCDVLVGSGRPSSAVIIAADTVYLIAAAVQALASRGCNQVLVVLGAGGNGSSVCIPVDVVFYVAQAVRNKVSACNDDFTARTVDAVFGRLDHIHTDVENSVANDNANKTAIINNSNTNTTAITGAVTTATLTITANDNVNKAAIVTNDNANTTNIIANANANKGDVIVNANSNTTTITTAISNAQTTIVSNDNANKNTIIFNDNANKNTIIANDNANATMLRDLILRTQIEADLASTDGSVFVALYMTPGVKGGYLELTRSIVVQTIANIGGANTAQANALLAKGDAYKAAGDYGKAYSYYRHAFKKAQGF